MNTFPIITKEIQENFEAAYAGTERKDSIPDICGYCGRACRQLDKVEGAIKMICTHCALADYAEGR